MSIRQTAQELYQIGKKIDLLKKQMENANEEEKNKLRMELSQLEKEKVHLRRKLDNLKGKPLPIQVSTCPAEVSCFFGVI